MPLTFLRSRAPVKALLSAFVLTALAGCSSKHTGVGAVGTDGKNVDPSWITATESCWPDLAKQGYHRDDTARALATAIHFRNAFPVYAAQNDSAIDLLLAKPVQTAPPPDVSKLTHSQTPVLSRGQAANGTGPQGAGVQSTNGIAPPDALCAIQPGTPSGFSK